MIASLAVTPADVVWSLTRAGAKDSPNPISFIWSKIDEEDPPRANTELAPWGKVLGAAAIQGATFAVTKAAVERSGAKGFEHLTGVWPGERRPDAE